ncbi:hypothetical protein D3C87_1040770 [compost metagenome]
MEEIKELQKGVNDILITVAEIKVEMRNLAGLSAQVATTERNGLLLEQKVVVLTKRFEDLEDKLKDEKRTASADKKWLIGLVIGSAALVWKIVDFLSNLADTIK